MKDPHFVAGEYILHIPDAKNLPGFNHALTDDLLQNSQTVVRKLLGTNPDDVTLRRYDDKWDVSRLLI